jgi:hypothetical protein
LAWVVWRRYRTTLIATIGVLALVAVYLFIEGHRIRSAYAAANGCRPVDSALCRFRFQNFHDTYGQGGLIGVILLFLPGLVGAFAGAPVLARELETGTFRYAWTQGVGRTRWTIALLAPGAVGAAVLMAAFGLLVSWYEHSLFKSGISQRLDPAIFPTMGLATAGWALAGFAFGAFAGVLWRRVIPALVTAVAVWFGLAFLTATTLRPHYLTPRTTTDLQLPDSAFSVTQWWTKGGVRVSDAQINTVLSDIGAQFSSNGNSVKVGGPGGGVDPVQYLVQQGYLQVTSYQPNSRYWTFQWIEFGWLTVLALILLATTLWLVRRRPA